MTAMQILVGPISGNLHFVTILSEDYQYGRLYVCMLIGDVFGQVAVGGNATVRPQGGRLLL